MISRNELFQLAAAVWRKSSYSGGSANCVEVADLWRTSSYSGGSADCVEVSDHRAASHGLRDSKAPDGAALFVSSAEWSAFLKAARDGHL
ncbi:DUF397 domain-containing protein [Allosalinactinospora lopnorensis]|uniref:DUF397 domain-containing protein n=1 Tax=Allosalinactinospora lopnorensis TaxID=1352348 RepID=UPI000623FE60|nr:DUF397 domain-containing protein [Allosalinactinospora lopnorensis]